MSEDETAIVALDQVLRRADGTSRPREEAVRLYGHRAVWVAELQEALRARLADARPLSVPPRIFLSYRWGIPEQDQWVENLVAELRRRGYFVIFDRTDKREATVPEFVSRLADCHVFLAVLDPGYIERVGSGVEQQRTLDGWVFDEYNSASFLAQGGRLRMIGLLREGETLPGGFRFASPGRLGNTLDVRDPEKLQAVLQRYFPELDSLPDSESLTRVEGWIGASHAAATSGRLTEAYELAARAAAEAPAIVDGHAQQARVAVQANRSTEGLAAARRALDIAPESVEMLSLAAACAYHEGEPQEAIRLSVRVLELDSGAATAQYTALAHYYLGNSLDDLGQPYAGVAHLELAARLRPDEASFHNDAGFVYRRIGNVERALTCFARGLEVASEDRNLLVNLAATEIEAGQPAAARRALAALDEHHRGDPAVCSLGVALDRWLAEGGSAPRLVSRVPERQRVGTLRCDRCALELPLVSDTEVLCSGCGAERLEAVGPCVLCGADGLVICAEPVVAMFRCPCCREGSLARGQ